MQLQTGPLRLAGLLERGPHDVERDSLDLDIHLQRGDAFCGASDLEVHVAVVIFEALDVREDGPSVAVRHQPHRDAADHLLDRNTGVHQREGRAARRGHRRGAVRFERLADDAAGVRELLLRRQDREDRALGERSVADLAAARAAHHAHLADGERREVVVVHVALGVDR